MPTDDMFPKKSLPKWATDMFNPDRDEGHKSYLEHIEKQVAQEDAAELARLAEVKNLKDELERERNRLAACSVAALGYFNGCHDDYKSASLDDVLRLRTAHDANAEIVRRAVELAQAVDDFCGELFGGANWTDHTGRVANMTRINDASRIAEMILRDAAALRAGAGGKP